VLVGDCLWQAGYERVDGDEAVGPRDHLADALAVASPKWGLARSRLRAFWSGFVLTGVSSASCAKRPDVAVRSARHEAGGYALFIKLSAGLGSCFPQLFGENKARIVGSCTL
jgi:hypothetical protein